MRAYSEPGPPTSKRRLEVMNIPKPQLEFKDLIDNSKAPFVPLLTTKPNALRPLSASELNAMSRNFDCCEALLCALVKSGVWMVCLCEHQLIECVTGSAAQICVHCDLWDAVCILQWEKQTLASLLSSVHC